MIIRKAIPTDAERLIVLMKHVEESKHMLYEPGERQTTSEQLEKRLTSSSEETVVFVAEEQTDLIGYLFAIGDTVKRKQHSVYLVIGVHQHCRAKGTGTQLLRAVETWAIDKMLHRIELTVLEKNTAAIALYKKMGFMVEGVKRDSICIDGEYANELYMAKLLKHASIQ